MMLRRVREAELNNMMEQIQGISKYLISHVYGG